MSGTVRGQGYKSPRDLTGRRAQQLTAEKRARDAAEKPSASALDAARDQGFNLGYDRGAAAWKTALVDLYKAEGIKAVEEWLSEEVA